MIETGAAAVELPRIASMNVCTDQLLLTLADPGQVLGLSRYARGRRQSWAADDARRYRILSGGAEDVLARVERW
ncbi:MAG: iron complex transport system substrate-binding protein [Bradyrhizobium sp.]|jgi:iron complex transport system substrate-binding protein|nr:iron complex transport system substrate-binding protein [Bradyrhizobium sp.]